MAEEEDPSGTWGGGVELLAQGTLSSSMSPRLSICFLGQGPHKGPTKGAAERTVIGVGLREDTTKEASESGLQ